MLQPDIDVNVSDYNIHGFSNLVMSLLFLLYYFIIIFKYFKLQKGDLACKTYTCKVHFGQYMRFCYVSHCQASIALGSLHI